MLITIEKDGTGQALYTEKIDLAKIGIAEMRRASHVEPLGTQWTADMSPVGGPTLGPFDTRSEALAAEVDWLEKNALCRPTRQNFET